jgi:PTS system glucose-specific IIA component
VTVGERITTYAPRQLGRLGFDPLVPVVAMQQNVVATGLLPGEPCEPGDVLFEL